MAQLVVRNLDDDTKERLSQRAARRGHSMEKEVREILRAAVAAWSNQGVPKRLGTRIAKRFAGFGPGCDVPELHGQATHPDGLGDA